MAEREEYIVNVKASEPASKGKPKKFILKEDIVDTRHLKDKSVTPDKLSDNFIDVVVQKVSVDIIDSIANLIIAKQFGNREDLTVSQKLMTDTVNAIYKKLGEITGETAVSLTVEPDYFVGEEGELIHIEATSISDVFEHVAIYINDVLVPESEATNVSKVEMDVELMETSTIKCKATVLGIPYVVEKTVTRYNSMWMGAGTNYQDIMDMDHLISFEGGMRKSYDVACNEGDHFIFIVGEHLRDRFIRADLNGLEIQLSSEMVTIAGKNYWVLTSENIYHEGTYNIDING